jgi:hypothetical protein
MMDERSKLPMAIAAVGFIFVGVGIGIVIDDMKLEKEYNEVEAIYMD